ncbi:MAG: hypothetical protein ACFE9L_06055 [Candidatus Hodarchaeota archaeon]
MVTPPQNSQKVEDDEPEAKKLPDLILAIRTLPEEIKSERIDDLNKFFTELPSILENIYKLQEDWLTIINVMGDIVIYQSVHEKRLETASKDFTSAANSYVDKIEAANRASHGTTLKSIELIKESLTQLESSRNQFVSTLQDRVNSFNSILEKITHLQNTALPEMIEKVSEIKDSIPNLMDTVNKEYYIQTQESIKKYFDDQLNIILEKSQENTERLLTSKFDSLKLELHQSWEKFTEDSEKLKHQLQNNTQNIDEIKSNLELIESKMISPLDVVKGDILEGKALDSFIYQSHGVSYFKEEHKVSTLKILDNLIKDFSNTEIQALKGNECKRLLIDARTSIYEKTEKIAPRFRLSMDALIRLFQDDLIYDRSSFDSIVDKLQHLKAIYEKAPILDNEID